MDNPYSLITQLLEDIQNQRMRDVIARRFGLLDGSQRTLQEIGDQYNITRERVRQIEKNGLDYLASAKIQEKLSPLYDEISDYLKQHGEVRRESTLMDEMVCYCFPSSEIEAMRSKKDLNLDLCRAALNLILTLGKPFNRYMENEDFYSHWALGKNSVVTAKKTVDSATKFLKQNKQVINADQLYQAIKKDIAGVSDKAVFSYVDASKLIEKNPFGELGLIMWPEISPRGVRDKAYLILKKEGKPFHFAEITNLINQHLPQSRPAYVQTVHNELIKDPRFVLIGRGIYALNEWGYEPGTVVDVIKTVLKEKGPLGKDEIIKNVLAKRLIKENTILINLQNKKYFKKLEDGRFFLV